jgi:hypothetical protein
MTSIVIKTREAPSPSRLFELKTHCKTHKAAARQLLNKILPTSPWRRDNTATTGTYTSDEVTTASPTPSTNPNIVDLKDWQTHNAITSKTLPRRTSPDAVVGLEMSRLTSNEKGDDASGGEVCECGWAGRLPPFYVFSFHSI